MKTSDKIDTYLTEKKNKMLIKGKLQKLDREIDKFILYLENKIDVIDDAQYPVFQRKMEQLLADTTKEHGEFMLALRNVAAALDRGPMIIAADKGVAKGVNVAQKATDTEDAEEEAVEDEEEVVESIERDVKKAENYIKKLKNQSKKEYAKKYLKYVIERGKMPSRGKLSYMAAQAVEMNIDEIMANI